MTKSIYLVDPFYNIIEFTNFKEFKNTQCIQRKKLIIFEIKH